MAKHTPGRRPKPEGAPQQPRDRLAEIRVEIRIVQQQIEAKRRDPRLIRTAEDLRAWERSIGELTDRLAALLLAEAMQAALDDPETRRRARPGAQGAGHTLKDQGPRDVTLRTTRGPVAVRVPYFSRNCDRDRRGKGMYPRASAHLSVIIKGLRESPSTNKGESEGFPGDLGTALEAQCLPLFPTVASY